MKKIIIIFLFSTFHMIKAQTVDEIDKLRFNVLDSLDRYDCFSYLNDSTLNENSHQYDTAYFYTNENHELVYLKRELTKHYYHMQGDIKIIEELYFIDNQIVFLKEYSFSFENPQWHREPDINETIVEVSETSREYYKIDGEPLLKYKPRRTEGKYKNRFTVLDSIPLENRFVFWSDRCDSCYEEYIEIFNDLISSKKDKK